MYLLAPYCKHGKSEFPNPNQIYPTLYLHVIHAVNQSLGGKELGIRSSTDTCSYTWTRPLTHVTGAKANLP